MSSDIHDCRAYPAVSLSLTVHCMTIPTEPGPDGAATGTHLPPPAWNPPQPGWSPVPTLRPAIPRKPTALELALKEGLLDRFPSAAAPSAAIGLACLGAVTADVLFHDGVGGFGVALFTLSLAAALVATRIVIRPQAIAMLATAIALAGIWVIRDSPWVRIPTGIALCSCVIAATFFGRDGNIFDVPWNRLVRSPAALIAHTILAPRWLGRGVARRVKLPRGLSLSVLGRALLIAVPVLGVLLSLLVSADPLFRSVVRLPFDLKSWPSQLMTLLVGTGVAIILARIALCEPARESLQPRRRILGNAEITVILSGMTLLLGAFVATQLVATLGFGRTALEHQGTTYASYARSGYFQLLWVVAIDVTVLTVLDAVGGGPARRGAVRILSLSIVVMTLAVGVTAVHRLLLYDRAYGFTMLRVACLFGALFLAVLLVAVGVWVGGLHSGKQWLPGIAGLSLVAVVIVFGLINPEQLVVNYDVAHRHTIALDAGYLSRLSEDSVPALVSVLPTIEPRVRSPLLRQALCSRSRTGTGWAQADVAATTADRALTELCDR